MEKSAMTRSYDLVVIGAGPAGESAAELASFLGHSVVIVEKNKPGGVVTTTGGAPTKTLRESMLALTGFYNREVYGITASAPPQPNNTRGQILTGPQRRDPGCVLRGQVLPAT